MVLRAGNGLPLRGRPAGRGRELRAGGRPGTGRLSRDGLARERWTLFATAGTGSAIVEAALALVAHSGASDRATPEIERVEVDYPKEGPRSERLFELNPLGQLPTLVLADGTVMTESAAIVLLLAERFPEAGLAPAPGDPERASFLRWLVFLVAAIYPTFTYGDFPTRWVPEEAGASLVGSTDRHRESLWRWLEREVVGEPWFLGERFSALDLYVHAMAHWRPRWRWFAAECPRVTAIAERCGALPALAEVWARNFPRR